MADKAGTYKTVAQEILSVVDGEANTTAKMASVACLLHAAFDSFSWTGFYVVDPENPEELVVGPYQGGLGCLRIPFGKGVCGTVAASGETEVVADVHAFPGHIACDSETNSEIVVPVRNASGSLIAVLDVDSQAPANFDGTDKAALEDLVAKVFG